MIDITRIPFVGSLLPTSAGQAIRQFAKRFGLVYFGKVDHRYDEHAVVRGITASSTHSDRHFAVGVIKGWDVSILERSNVLRFPNKPDETYTWVIIQVDLKDVRDVPHIFLDAHHHDEVFYANLFMKFANFKNASSAFGGHDALFAERFKAYAPTDMIDELEKFFTPEVTEMLAHHFSQFDYEVQNDTIYVYCNSTTIRERDIERMARVGLWLAENLEQHGQPKPSHE